MVFLGELKDILFAHERLAAGKHEPMAAKLLGLGDNLVALIIGEVKPVAIVS